MILGLFSSLVVECMGGRESGHGGPGRLLDSLDGRKNLSLLLLLRGLSFELGWRGGRESRAQGEKIQGTGFEGLKRSCLVIPTHTRRLHSHAHDVQTDTHSLCVPTQRLAFFLATPPLLGHGHIKSRGHKLGDEPFMGESTSSRAHSCSSCNIGRLDGCRVQFHCFGWL